MALSTTPDTGRNERILVVEDEKPLAQIIATYQMRAGFQALQVHSGRQARQEARVWEPDVVILDLGLPGMDGLEVCRTLRAFSDCYVLILTARGREDDKVQGLAAGADDYITKPFSVRELVARVQAMLRRPRAGMPDARHQEPRVCGNLVIDTAAHEARAHGVLVPLTRTEFDLLTVLAERPNQVMSRRQLIAAVWDTSWVGDERVVDVHLGNVRRKLGMSRTDSGYIETIRGVGYRMGGR